MFEFLRFGRARKNLQPKAIDDFVDEQAKKNDIRLEMIRLALKSVLRRSGIPLPWIGCEVVPLARSGDSDVMLIQLVILHWHDGLMRYAPELQHQLLKEIQFFDSTAQDSSLLIAWKFAPDCGYPDESLPEAGFWAPAPAAAPAIPVELAKPVAAATVAAAVVLPPAKFDLPKSKLDEVDGDDGFPATQIFEEK